MTRRHTPLQQFKEAQQIARDHNMFVVDKGDNFLLYRRAAPTNVYIGKRHSAAGIRALVCKAANLH